jgi:hypothetical protein
MRLRDECHRDEMEWSVQTRSDSFRDALFGFPFVVRPVPCYRRPPPK